MYFLAIASITCNARNLQSKNGVNTILSWNDKNSDDDITFAQSFTEQEDNHNSRIHILGSMLEKRLRMVISKSEVKKNSTKKKELDDNVEVRRSERLKRLNDPDYVASQHEEEIEHDERTPLVSEQIDDLYDPLSIDIHEIEDNDSMKENESSNGMKRKKKSQSSTPTSEFPSISSKSSFSSNKSNSILYNDDCLFDSDISKVDDKNKLDDDDVYNTSNKSRHSFSSCSQIMDEDEESSNQNSNENDKINAADGKEEALGLLPDHDEYGDEWW